MTYEEFCNQYTTLIKKGCSKNLSFERRLSLGNEYSDLVEAYPEYEERADNDASIWDALKK